MKDEGKSSTDKAAVLGNTKAGPKPVGKGSDPAGAMSMSEAASFATKNPRPGC